MSGNSPRPTDINLHQKSRVLEISFEDGKTFSLPCEFLRVYSPSAEVRGHGPGQEVLQVGKEDVNIEKIEPVEDYLAEKLPAGYVLRQVIRGIEIWHRLYTVFWHY